MNGKRMGRIDRHGRQHREHLVEEDRLQPVELAHRHLGGVFDHHAPRRPSATFRLRQMDCWRRSRSVAAVEHLGELLGGGEAVLADDADALAHLPLQAGDAHHVEFIEVVGGDRQETQPLQQRVALVLALVQHALS